MGMGMGVSQSVSIHPSLRLLLESDMIIIMIMTCHGPTTRCEVAWFDAGTADRGWAIGELVRFS